MSMSAYDSLLKQLEAVAEQEGWHAPASVVARISTIAERMALARSGSAAFVEIERHPVFPLLSLPPELIAHVLSQLQAEDMADAAQICTACSQALPEAIQKRCVVLGARHLPPLFTNERPTHAMKFIEEFWKIRSYTDMPNWSCWKGVDMGTSHALMLVDGGKCVNASHLADADPLLEPPCPALVRPSTFTAHLGHSAGASGSHPWASPGWTQDWLPALALPPDTDPRFVSVEAGCLHSLSLNDAGEVWSCGCGPLLGRLTMTRAVVFPQGIEDADLVDQLGNADVSAWLDPMGVGASHQSFPDQSTVGRVLFSTGFKKHYRVVQIACGAYHSLCLTDMGELFGWGYNKEYQVDGKEDDSRTLIALPQKIDKRLHMEHGGPTREYQASDICSIAAGAKHSAAVTWDGSLYTWGGQMNYYRRERHDLPYAALGVDNSIDRHSGMQAVMGPAFEALVTDKRRDAKRDRAHGRMAAADQAAELEPANERLHGNEYLEHLESFMSDTEEEEMPEAAHVFVDVCSCGWSHTLAMSKDGELYSFGENAYGECGLGGDAVTVADRRTHTPTRVIVEPDVSTDGGRGNDNTNYRVVQVSAGRFRSVMLTVHHEVFVCGRLVAPPTTPPSSAAFKILTRPSMVEDTDSPWCPRDPESPWKDMGIMEVRAGEGQLASVLSVSRNRCRSDRQEEFWQRVLYASKDQPLHSWTQLNAHLRLQ